MPVFCGVCSEPCVVEDVKCSGTCNRVFHANCIKEDLEIKKTRSNWKCKDCRTTSKTSSCGSTTSTALTKELLIRVMEDFKKEVFQELKSFRKEMGEMTDSMQFLSDKVDTSNTLMMEIKKEFAELKKENEELRDKNRKLAEEVGELKDRMRDMEQYSRRNNVELNGIPVTPGENVMAVVEGVGRALGVQITQTDVEAAHRVPSFTKGRTPALIVRFHTREMKNALISKYREKKTLDTKEVNPAYSAQRVYVNEHLSPENKQFLALLKKRCSEAGYAFVWSRDGKFFARKAPGEAVKKINTLKELNNVR